MKKFFPVLPLWLLVIELSASSKAMCEPAKVESLSPLLQRVWVNLDQRIFPPSEELKSFREGVGLFQDGKVDEALAKFMRASHTDNKTLKAKALHNAASVHIQKKDLTKARDDLRSALAYDNDNVDIRENLAWVEAQMKKTEKNPEQKDQNQATDPQQKDQEQKSAEEKNAENQSSQKKSGQDKNEKNQDKPADSKSDEQKSAENSQKDKDSIQEQQQKGASKDKDGSQAEAKPKDDAQSQSAKRGEDENKPSTDKKQQAEAVDKAKQEPKDGLQTMGGENPAGSPNDQGQSKQALLTPVEIQQQEAERLLRTIDDKIGQYPMIETEATGKRGNDGKNW